MAVRVTIFVDVDNGPATRLRKDSNIGISRDPVVGFAVLTVDKNVASGVLLNNWRWADGEAALIKDRPVAACVDFACTPCTDAAYARILQVRINVEAI